MKKIRFYRQHDRMDCGPACLKMIADFYGKSYSINALRDACFISRQGVSLLDISDAAESIGFKTLGVKISFETLKREVQPPAIVHWKQNHFIIICKVSKTKVWVCDPIAGHLTYSTADFVKGWSSNGDGTGIALLIEPTSDFYTATEDDDKSKGKAFAFLFSYLRSYKSYFFQLSLALFFSSILQLIFPLLTQAIVDIGINSRNIGFINLVLIGQVVLFVSKSAVDFIRSWILLHLSTRINISLISNFLIKILKLPISFFETKMIGDLLQRINDHSRIETLLSSSTLNIAFSVFNFIVFGALLAFYNTTILGVFLIGSTVYLIFIIVLLKRRRALDFKRFRQLSANQSNLIQIINGMQEIKLSASEKLKRWSWEKIQVKLFKITVKSTALTQVMQGGGLFINELKNIFITFLSATAVINGEMTFGMMLAVQYIIGQLNAPLTGLISFLKEFQDAKISLERIEEINHVQNEDDLHANGIAFKKLDTLDNQTITLDNVSFQYKGRQNAPKILENIDLVIPDGKITAIVGPSGSGKTTLLKLLLKFYPPTSGEIYVGGETDKARVSLNVVDHQAWRRNCGVVMQDGFIFTDSIANNVALGEESIDRQRLIDSLIIANILEFVNSLPAGYESIIGKEGIGLSQGQKQRILIARAVYKNPKCIFFDEATSSLDANNEKEIMANLTSFFKKRTVVIIAHRLSTVRDADQIIVLNRSKIIERGTHQDLIGLQGDYFRLIKNQLELEALSK